MSRILSPKLREISTEEQGRVLMHWCPGCARRHGFEIDKPNASGAIWSWNGDAEAPSFTPSMHITSSVPAVSGPELKAILLRRQAGEQVAIPYHQITICHYILTAGKIHFLPDSGHALAGKKVDLPDFPEWAR